MKARVRRDRPHAEPQRVDRARSILELDAAVREHQVRRRKTWKAGDCALELARGLAPAAEPDEGLSVVVVRLEAVDPARRQLAEAGGGRRVLSIAQLGEACVEQLVQHAVLV